MSAKFPDHVQFRTARYLISEFVTDSLVEFQVCPTKDQLQQYIEKKYVGYDCVKYYSLLIQLTPEEALNTVSSRSMATYKAPIRKRTLSEDEKKKVKEFKTKRRKKLKCQKNCEICQEKLTRHIYTLKCKCQFHGACIRKALQYSNKCPLCYKPILKTSPSKE